MKIKDAYCYLLIFSFVTLFLVLYWRQFIVTKSENAVKKQNNTTTPTRTLVNAIKQCDIGSFFSQIDDACLPCGKGTFSLEGWIGCVPWLECESIEQNVRRKHLLSTPSGINAVKYIYLADWYDYNVVYMKCAHGMFWEDCENNAKMLQAFHGSEFVTQLIGICLEKQEVVTTFYRYGSADKLDELLPRLNLTPENELQLRIQLVKDYLKILDYLHNSPIGVRVMCDTNDLTKTLSQFLITDTLHLIVNDLDALPEVNHKAGKLIKCGHRELQGWFVAPEQLWPRGDEPFNDTEMPGYDEKIDIWKIPDVLMWFLGETVNGLRIKASLRTVFNQCKANYPKARPTAHTVLQFFERIMNELHLEINLVN